MKDKPKSPVIHLYECAEIDDDTYEDICNRTATIFFTCGEQFSIKDGHFTTEVEQVTCPDCLKALRE